MAHNVKTLLPYREEADDDIDIGDLVKKYATKDGDDPFPATEDELELPEAEEELSLPPTNQPEVTMKPILSLHSQTKDEKFIDIGQHDVTICNVLFDDFPDSDPVLRIIYQELDGERILSQKILVRPSTHNLIRSIAAASGYSGNMTDLDTSELIGNRLTISVEESSFGYKSIKRWFKIGTSK